MKKIILSLIAVMAISLTAVAQGENRQRGQRMDPTEMIKRRTQQMVERYNLSDEQAAALQALNEKSMAQMGQRMGNGQRAERNDSVAPRKRDGNRERGQRGEGMQRGNRGGQRGGFGAFNEEYNNELQKILTPEQYKAYTEDMQKMRERMGQRPNFGGQRGGFRGGNE